MKFIASFTLFFFFITLVSQAQLRQDLVHQPEEYTGAITHTHSENSPGSWMNMLNMTMSHSYSMSFSNFGGQMQNLNAYTNSMHFDVSDRMDAQLDVSVLHSPFGNSFMNNSSAMDTQIIIDRARVDYRLSENTRISFEFSQNPYYSTFGRSGFGNYYAPVNRRSAWY
jgi:hypothetical protein